MMFDTLTMAGETYGSGRYQEQQSPYAPGCLEQAIEAAAEVLAGLRPASG